jgi:hypothetical protein
MKVELLWNDNNKQLLLIFESVAETRANLNLLAKIPEIPQNYLLARPSRIQI